MRENLKDYELVERRMRVFGKDDARIDHMPQGFKKISRMTFGDYLTITYKDKMEQILIEVYKLKL